ncbi:hypothetical protein KM043_004644 [Ampulex compressa]|nr:hypothetical protein KM043_004644 [Ampulex compressa]
MEEGTSNSGSIEFRCTAFNCIPKWLCAKSPHPIPPVLRRSYISCTPVFALLQHSADGVASSATDIVTLNCRTTTNSSISSSISNGGKIQSLHSINSGNPNLVMSPLSTLDMWSVGMNPCNPMGMSLMGPHSYATPVTSSFIRTVHSHKGDSSPTNEVWALCCRHNVYYTGNSLVLFLYHPNVRQTAIFCL